MNFNENAQYENGLAGKPFKGFDVFYFLFRRSLSIGLLGLLIFLFTIPFILMTSQTFYTSEGFLLLERVSSSISGSTNALAVSNYFEDYANTQAIRIESYDVLEGALKKMPRINWPSFLNKDISIEKNVLLLQKKLTVQYIEDTLLIRVSIETDEPAGIAGLINQVMESYIDKEQQSQDNFNLKRFSYLRGKLADLEEKLEAAEQEMSKLVFEVGSSTFDQRYNVYSQKLAALDLSYGNMSAGRYIAEGEYKAALKAKEDLLKLPLSAMADELVASDQSLWHIDFWTYSTLQEMRATIDGVTVKNPDRMFVEARMSSMEDYLKNHKEVVAKRAMNVVIAKRDYEINKNLILAEQKYKAALDAESMMAASVDDVRKLTKEISEKLREGIKLENKITGLRGRIQPIENKLQELAADTQSPARISIESNARDPFMPSRTNTTKIMAIAFVFSFALIIGPIFLYDLMDDRVRRVMELNNALGRTAPDPITEYDLKVSHKPFVRATLDVPIHPAVSAMRRLVIRLDKERKVNGARCAIFSGLERGSGATEIVINMAHAMTSFCPRVLLVEADNLHPSVGRILNLDLPANYLEDYIDGKVSWEDCLVHDAERGIDTLFFRKINWSNGQYREFAYMLASAKLAYDFIFIDSGPILERPLTQYLALQADITVLVLHEDVSLYGELRHAMELLHNASVPAMTAVLNFSKPVMSKLLMKRIQEEVLKISKSYEKYSEELLIRFMKRPEVLKFRAKFEPYIERLRKRIGF